MLPVSVPVSSYLEKGTFFRITSVGSAVSGGLAAVLTIAGILFILYFIWGALSWLTAGGDKSAIEGARQRISNALIGLTLIAAAWAIYLIVLYMLGLGGAIGTAGGGGSENGGATATPGPSGYCVCGGDAGCVTPGTIGPRGISDPTCYRCEADGSWSYVGGDCAPITCGPCP